MPGIPYRYFQETHPAWPRRIGDMMGRQVRLRREIETNKGSKYPKGTLFWVIGVHRGWLQLSKDPHLDLIGVRKVPPSDCELAEASC